MKKLALAIIGIAFVTRLSAQVTDDLRVEFEKIVLDAAAWEPSYWKSPDEQKNILAKRRVAELGRVADRMLLEVVCKAVKQSTEDWALYRARNSGDATARGLDHEHGRQKPISRISNELMAGGWRAALFLRNDREFVPTLLPLYVAYMQTLPGYPESAPLNEPLLYIMQWGGEGEIKALREIVEIYRGKAHIKSFFEKPEVGWLILNRQLGECPPPPKIPFHEWCKSTAEEFEKILLTHGYTPGGQTAPQRAQEAAPNGTNTKQMPVLGDSHGEAFVERPLHLRWWVLATFIGCASLGIVGWLVWRRKC